MLNYLRKQIKSIAIATILCLSAIAFAGPGGTFNHHAAIAAPLQANILATDMDSQIKEKAREDAGSAKGFIRDAANQVEKTANQNANKIQQATDTNGNFLERKANKDAATIQQRAEQDAARTQQAVDDTKNVIERTVDNIRDTFD